MISYNENAKILKVVSDPKRLKIIEILSCGERCARDILKFFDFTQPTLSYHMKVLAEASIVNVRKEGLGCNYSLNKTKCNEIIIILMNIINKANECICKEIDNKNLKQSKRGGIYMKKMVIYDPAMCCSTGVCGPSVDKNLLRVSTLLNRLEKKGVKVERHNLSENPKAYVDNKIVNQFLVDEGVDVLPITIVDGEVVKTKEYPTNEEFVKLLEIPEEYIMSELSVKKSKEVK